jgi:uncharacterized protein (TIGR02757 family)
MPVRNKPSRSKDQLKKTLNTFYKEYNFNERLYHDPIEFPHRYSDPEDIEVAGFIAACFAYGKVDLFKPVIENILNHSGRHPAHFIRNFAVKKDAGRLKGISYRFNKEKDILCYIYILSQALKRWGSLKNLLYHHYKSDQDDIRTALDGFVSSLLNTDTTAVYKKNIKPPGLTQLLPVPSRGSACKRMNLYLRWMVRKADIDLGIWDAIPPSKLIIPLDTHILRISRCLGLTSRTASDWKTAREITESLRKMAPGDPLKYDFALCHQGISGLCKGEKSVETCSSCILLPA